MRAFKYLLVLTLPVCVYFSFTGYGVVTFLPLFYSFVFIPILELFVSADHSNHSDEEEKSLLSSRLYDYLLYLIIPIQYGFLIFFLFTINDPNLKWWEIIGRVSSMGIMCGVMGINVAHELGHRTKKSEQFLSKVLLLTSLYMHFFIEHNRGHHKNVSTPEDPASARLGENLYAFWFRSVIRSYWSAWKLEFERMKKNNLPLLSIKNEMLQFQVIQIVFIGSILLIFGWEVALGFLSAAIFGFLLLETVNYIEHYGLSRIQVEEGRYERVQPSHSWNSDHIIGRLLLFELSRHSDHHYLASRKYQILRHMDNSPQMPTGYPGMMMLSIVPPVWFTVIHRYMRRNELISTD